MRDPRRHGQFSARAIEMFTATGFAPGFRMETKGDLTEILIYDSIGDDGWGGGVSASAITAALKATKGGAVTVRINSPGGDVWDGMAIYNALLAHPGEVTCQVDGIAASAASFIACAGARVIVAETSMVMIHNARTIAFGDRNSMAETVALLAKVDGQIAAIYAGKSGGDAADFAALMDAETWLTAEEAKARGLADAVAVAPKREKTKAEAPAAPIAEAPVAVLASAHDIEVRRRRLQLRVNN